jgi:hypothetical protein
VESVEDKSDESDKDASEIIEPSNLELEIGLIFQQTISSKILHRMPQLKYKMYIIFNLSNKG